MKERITVVNGFVTVGDTDGQCTWLYVKDSTGKMAGVHLNPDQVDDLCQTLQAYKPGEEKEF